MSQTPLKINYLQFTNEKTEKSPREKKIRIEIQEDQSMLISIICLPT